MKNNSTAKFLEVMLLIVWWGLLILFTISTYYTLKDEGVSFSYFFFTIRALIIIIYLFGLNRLKKIANSIVHKKPFTAANVVFFKQIGYSIFTLGIINTILNFPSMEGPLLIGTPYGSIKPDIFVYLILGSLALVLAEIFNEALNIKNENELTI